MTHAFADPDGRFLRPASPFAPEQALHQLRADVIERLAITRIEALVTDAHPVGVAEREGALLISAILFGALLDHRRWADWLVASRGWFVGIGTGARRSGQVVSKKTILEMPVMPRLHHHGRVWVELPAIATREASRWIADPLTETLLLHWQAIRAEVVDPVPTPAEAISAFLRWGSFDPARSQQLLDGLHRAAVFRWRLRMPAFLVDEIGVDGGCVSLTEERWFALLNARTSPISLPYEAKSSTFSTKSQPGDPVLRIIASALPAGRHSGRASFIHAGHALASAACSSTLKPVERHVLAWAADRIDPTRDHRQRKRRLAPSTVLGRARRLLTLLKDIFGSSDPQMLDVHQFAERLNDYLDEKGFGRDDRAHLSCFTDWQQRRMPSLAVCWRGGPRSRRSGVRNTIVSQAEYAVLLDRFDQTTANGTMLRLLVILGFRAGLRWDEAINLRLNDLVQTCRHVELSICRNRDYLLKALASRRTVPLHILLSDAELNELRAWWSDRMMMAKTTTASHSSDTARLFPRWGTTLHNSMRHTIQHALAEITGNSVWDFHQLRHSCSSYLLATLALPGEMDDADLVPRIDPALVSQARRQRVAPVLMGEGTRNAVHAVGAVLGHSGDHTTLRSYMHLHDWLVGVHVSRRDAQPRLPASLAAALLGMSVSAVERADRRATSRMCGSSSPARRRGRPRAGARRETGITLGRHLRFLLPEASSPPVPDPLPSRSIDGPPDWHALAAFMGASDEPERESLRQHPQLSSHRGRSVVSALLSLLETQTRGRGGVTRPRFIDRRTGNEPRTNHRLTATEAERLGRLYVGLLSLDATRRRLLCSIFVEGYDRPRGVLRVSIKHLAPVLDALRRADCRDAEMTVTTSKRSATIKVGAAGRTDRGFLWAMLFATAVHRADKMSKARKAGDSH